MKEVIAPSKVVIYYRLIKESGPRIGILASPKEPKTRICRWIGVLESYLRNGSLNRPLYFSNVPENYKKVVLDNTGFNIEISNDLPKIWDYPNCDHCTEVIISHKDLSEKVKIICPMHVLLQCISGVGYIVDNVLAGSYCFMNTSSSAPLNYNIILEDPNNKDLLEAKKKGVIQQTKKGTSKWIPGHVYLLKDNRYAVCLCNFTKDIMISRYWIGRERSFDICRTSKFDERITLIESPVCFKILNDISNLKRDSLISYVNDNIFVKNSNSYYLGAGIIVRSSKASKIVGIDMGEYFSYDSSTDIETFISLKAQDIVKTELRTKGSFRDIGDGVENLAVFCIDLFKDEEFKKYLLNARVESIIRRSKYNYVKTGQTAETILNTYGNSIDDLVGKDWVSITRDEIIEAINNKLKKD